MTAREFIAARRALGLSQSGIAAALEVTPRAVKFWEAGERAIPGPAAVALRLMQERAVVVSWPNVQTR